MRDNASNTCSLVLNASERVFVLQQELYQIAQKDRTFKFTTLYDKIRLSYCLEGAFDRIKANESVSDVYGRTLAFMDEIEIMSLLTCIEYKLFFRTYKPGNVIIDGIVQMACRMVMQPIFEADFPCQRKLIEKSGLKLYYDVIHREKLMFALESRIKDRNTLNLIRMWLKNTQVMGPSMIEILSPLLETIYLCYWDGMNKLAKPIHPM